MNYPNFKAPAARLGAYLILALGQELEGKWEYSGWAPTGILVTIAISDTLSL